MIRCFLKNFIVFRKNWGMSGKIFWLPKWYTDRKFFGDGGGSRRSGAKGGQKWPIDGGPPAVALRH